jgi:Ca2+-transporting ATPase
MLLAPLLGMPLPLLPIQILWINLVTDGAPALAMSYESGEPTVMTRSPYRPTEGVFARGVGRRILWVGLLVGIISLGVGFAAYRSDPDARAWQTMIFSTLTFCQLAFALTVRLEKQTVLGSVFFKNKILLASVVGTLVAQLLIVYLPFFQQLFKTVSLSPSQVSVCLATSLIVAVALEMEKYILRRSERRAALENRTGKPVHPPPNLL